VGFRAAISPTDLAKRRQRCAALADQIVSRLREFVPRCNMCGCERSAVIAKKDRYRVPSRTAMCMECGLIYQLDRLDDTEADRFYASGEYRDLVSRFSGSSQEIKLIHADQIQYGRSVIAALAGHLQMPCSAAKILDIGGSAGYVAYEFQEYFGAAATVLDPATQEVEAARKLGLEGIVASFETWEPDTQYDLVLLCRSIEHVRDLRSVLLKLRRCMTPAGYAYIDIVDFTELCRLVGPPEAVTKIDHCFWLTQECAPAIFRSIGLEIVTTNISPQPPLVGFLLRRCEPQPLPVADPARRQSELRDLLRRNSEWHLTGNEAEPVFEKLRRQAYRVKRFVQKRFE
jgi:ubiquinone/menaquinone biosynthesis C-methylase UbiE